MKYLNDNSIMSFLDEMSNNYYRLVDSILMYIDGDILLVNVGTKGFKLDNRLKTKSCKVFKSKTVGCICSNYRSELISEGEAVEAIKTKIQELESEVKQDEKKNGQSE